jgi:hypothetical protein
MDGKQKPNRDRARAERIRSDTVATRVGSSFSQVGLDQSGRVKCWAWAWVLGPVGCRSGPGSAEEEEKLSVSRPREPAASVSDSLQERESLKQEAEATTLLSQQVSGSLASVGPGQRPSGN